MAMGNIISLAKKLGEDILARDISAALGDISAIAADAKNLYDMLSGGLFATSSPNPEHLAALAEARDVLGRACNAVHSPAELKGFPVGMNFAAILQMARGVLAALDNLWSIFHPPVVPPVVPPVPPVITVPPVVPTPPPPPAVPPAPPTPTPEPAPAPNIQPPVTPPAGPSFPPTA